MFHYASCYLPWVYEGGLLPDLCDLGRLIIVRGGVPIGLFEANISEEEDAPDGWCWDYYIVALDVDRKRWIEIDGGRTWGFRTSYELLLFSVD